MQKVFIRGLVGLAKHVREELSAPLDADRARTLKIAIRQGLDTVVEALARHELGVDALPAPTRNAYIYLRSLDLDSLQTAERAGTARPSTSRVRLSGLRSYFDRLLDFLAVRTDPTDLEEAYDSVTGTCAKYQAQFDEHHVAPQELNRETRETLAWLRYFQARAHFDSYVCAVRVVRPLFEATATRGQRFTPPVLAHFRPMPGLYRVRGYADQTRVSMPTPTISFDRDGFEALAVLLFSRGADREPVMSRAFGEAYRRIQAELSVLAGDSAGARGAFHDLPASFEQVNARYFGGAMARPRLLWSPQITHCRFGYYHTIRDELTVSGTLDSADVPEFVLDFVVYHELLHKQQGVQWQNGRQAYHTPEFRAAEQKFDRYAEADLWLSRLARRYAAAAGA